MVNSSFYLETRHLLIYHTPQWDRVCVYFFKNLYKNMKYGIPSLCVLFALESLNEEVDLKWFERKM